MQDDLLHGTLVGVDGNAFAILGKFRKDARRAGWDAEKIKQVMDDAQSDDYDHLLATIASKYVMEDEDDGA
jgi:hypothetical protein